MFEFTFQFDTENHQHLYEQIYTYIKNEIREGKLPCGEKLPSSRALAEYLQVSRSTVCLAYEQLLSEGYVETKPYKGYYVCEISELQKMRIGEEKTSEPVYCAEKNDMENADEDAEYIDFSPNAVDMRYFPFDTWRRTSKNVLMDDKSELFSMGHPQGEWKLRNTIVNYLHQSRGVVCRPEQIMIGAGNDYLLMLLGQMFENDTIVAMEDPTYLRAYRMFSAFGWQVETIGMDEAGMKVEEIYQTKASLAYAMPSHQFPIGTVMPIGRRMELIKWAKQAKERYIIEDDYDSEFRFKGKPIPALAANDAEKVIYIGSFSKSVAPAIRVSFMVLPEKLLPLYQKKCGYLACTVSRVDQMILQEFIDSGSFARYLNKMRKRYKEKHDLLLTELKAFQPYYDIRGTEAGLHILISSKTGLPEKKLVELAKREGVKVYALSQNCRERNMAHDNTVLLGFGKLTEEEIKLGIGALKRAWLL